MKNNRQKWLGKKRRKNEKKKIERDKKNKKGSTKAKKKISSRINAVMLNSRQRKRTEGKKEKAKEIAPGVKMIGEQEHTQKKAPNIPSARAIESS